MSKQESSANKSLIYRQSQNVARHFKNMNEISINSYISKLCEGVKVIFRDYRVKTDKSARDKSFETPYTSRFCSKNVLLYVCFKMHHLINVLY